MLNGQPPGEVPGGQIGNREPISSSRAHSAALMRGDSSSRSKEQALQLLASSLWHTFEQGHQFTLELPGHRSIHHYCLGSRLICIRSVICNDIKLIVAALYSCFDPGVAINGIGII